jgi:hypothetical protein
MQTHATRTVGGDMKKSISAATSYIAALAVALTAYLF